MPSSQHKCQQLRAADAWCAAFFTLKTRRAAPISRSHLREPRPTVSDNSDRPNRRRPSRTPERSTGPLNSLTFSRPAGSTSSSGIRPGRPLVLTQRSSLAVYDTGVSNVEPPRAEGEHRPALQRPGDQG